MKCLKYKKKYILIKPTPMYPPPGYLCIFLFLLRQETSWEQLNASLHCIPVPAPTEVSWNTLVYVFNYPCVHPQSGATCLNILQISFILTTT